MAEAGRVLGTRDGGTRWHTEVRAPGARLTSLDVLDPTHAWAVGVGVVLRTVDGRRWTQVREPCPGLRSVSFRNIRDGVAVSDAPHGTLLGTTDGGRHWRRLPGPADVLSACFDSRDVGWLGTRGRVYYTDTAGRHWQAARGSFVAPSRYGGGVTVRCAGTDSGWAEWVSDGGAMSQSPHVGFRLHLGSATPIFAEQYFPDRTAGVRRSSPGSYPGPFGVLGPRSAVFVDSCVACASQVPRSRQTLVGSAPLSVATHDGRDLTRPAAIPTLSFAMGIDFVGRRTGWIVGLRSLDGPRPNAFSGSSLLLHTTDGGRTWVRQLAIRQ